MEHRSVALAAAATLLLAACGGGEGGGNGNEGTVDGGRAVRPDAAVVRFEVDPCQGNHELTATGVAVAGDTIATVAHAFDGARRFTVLADDRPRAASIVWLDEERDLALVQVGETPLPWLPLGVGEDGDQVDIVTFDEVGSATREATIVQHVNATLDGQGERAAIEVEADVNRGDSGAPVVNAGGEVVGMIFATVRDAPRGWAIAASEIEAALAQHTATTIPLSC